MNTYTDLITNIYLINNLVQQQCIEAIHIF